MGMKMGILRLGLVIFGSSLLIGCATENADSGGSEGVSPFATPGSSRLGIQEAQSKAVRRLSY